MVVEFVTEFSESLEVTSDEAKEELCGMDQIERPIWQVFVNNMHNFNGARLRMVHS